MLNVGLWSLNQFYCSLHWTLGINFFYILIDEFILIIYLIILYLNLLLLRESDWGFREFQHCNFSFYYFLLMNCWRLVRSVDVGIISIIEYIKNLIFFFIVFLCVLVVWLIFNISLKNKFYYLKNIFYKWNTYVMILINEIWNQFWLGVIILRGINEIKK